MATHTPLPYGTAARAVVRCTGSSIGLLARRRIHQPSRHVGLRLRFADGTTSRVYRETVVHGETHDPCVLVVGFRLRWVRGRGHALFRAESILNTPLFVGFPGFRSKLWMAHDQHGVYRGLYEWDGPERAEYYARSLWRVLGLVSEPDSIQYTIAPGLRRDALLADPHLLDTLEPDVPTAWWRPVAAL
jgi:hypothetical protein